LDVSTDYLSKIKLVTFSSEEDPTQEIPPGWVVISRTEPSNYKGFNNPGSLLCAPGLGIPKE
jgi:hypothetical protein